MAVDPPVFGYECKLYRQTTGTRAAWPGTGDAPDLEEVECVITATLNLPMVEADVTTRRSNAMKETEPVVLDPSVDATILRERNDADFDVLWAAYVGKTSIAIAALDGPSDEAGSHGLWADMKIVSWVRSEELEDKAGYDIVLKPCRSTVPPELVTTAT